MEEKNFQNNGNSDQKDPELEMQKKLRVIEGAEAFEEFASKHGIDRKKDPLLFISFSLIFLNSVKLTDNRDENEPIKVTQEAVFDDLLETIETAATTEPDIKKSMVTNMALMGVAMAGVKWAKEHPMKKYNAK